MNHRGLLSISNEIGRMIFGIILLCWMCGGNGADTIGSDASSTPSTTFPYVTRPPLILLTRGLDLFVNRSRPFGHRRNFAFYTSTVPATTSSAAASTTGVPAGTTVVLTDTTAVPSSTTAVPTSTTAFPSDASTKVSFIRDTVPHSTGHGSSSFTTPSKSTNAPLPRIISITPKPISSSVLLPATTPPIPKTSELPKIAIARDFNAKKLTSIGNDKKGVSDGGHVAAPVEEFALEAQPLGTTSVQVTFRPSQRYSAYYVNYTDVSQGDSGKHAGNTLLIDKTPFTISGLFPGHLYVLQLLGEPASKIKTSSEPQVALDRAFVATDPSAPRIASQNVTVTTNSISILATKEAGALQDYFLITYWETEESASQKSKTLQNLNVTDIPEQREVEFYVGGLKPGNVYNVSIIAFQRGKSSRKWSAIVVTTPLPPLNVHIVSSDANEIVLAWDRPIGSGVDSYYAAYRSESHPNVSEIDIRDLTLRLDSDIVPGERYYVDIYSVKGGTSFSEPVHLEIDTRPLPPLAMTVRPEFGTKHFEMIVSLAHNSRQDSCILQYTSDEGKGRASVSENITAIPNGDYCRWSLALAPGQTYQFLIWTARGTFSISDPYSNSTIIEPGFDGNLLGVTLLPTEKTLEIKWNNEAMLEYWKPMVGSDGNISATLMNAFQVTKSVNPMSSSTSGLVFDNLLCGACYTTQVYASIGGVVSRNHTMYRTRLDPSGVSILLTNITATTAVLNVKTELPPWTLDQSCRLVVSVKDDSNHTVLDKTLVTGQSAHRPTVTDWTSQIRVINLKAFNRYDVTSVHRCGNDGEDCEMKQRNNEPMKFETSQGVPGPVRNARVNVQTPSIAAIMWEPPGHSNGMIMSYVISIYPYTSSGEEPWNISLPVSFTSFTIQNLTGGFKYSFDVRAQTAVGPGPSLSSEVVTKELPTAKMFVWAPPKPYGRPEPLYNTIRSTDFSLRFNLSMFSTRNGLLEGYSVIVAEGEGASGNGSVGTWFDVQSSNVWPPYAALTKPLPRVKNLDSTSVTEVIGVDMDCSKMADKMKNWQSTSQTVVVSQFCNGPLRPGRKYRVKLRVYTTPELFTDSDYSDVVITSTETSTASGTAIAAILILVSLAALVSGVVLFLRGRGTDPLGIWTKAKNRLLPVRTDTVDGPTSVQTVSVTVPSGGITRRQRSLRERTGIDGRLDNLNGHNVHHHHTYLQLPTVLASADTDVSRPVLKCNFAEHVRLMSADSDFRFSEEFEELKQVGRSEACTAADVPCNRNKNRFTNILPYDHSRVKLVPVDDEEGSDYINASYIPGYNSPREYIAAQGPLPSTRDDFWRMVWEQNCPAVVNLTRCIEKGREKCDQYWPGDTDAVYYGDVEVLLMNETRFPDWTVREFKASHADQSRTVRHFHFTAWPDFGVPEKPQTLVKFVRALRARVPPSDASGPIVVHCSAGVGRSGTLIAIDRLIQHTEFHEFVDVYGMVYEMRKERAWMVQTEQQYICIHQCVLCVLEGRENDENSSFYAHRPLPLPVEIHQNPAFEDDEGIAESGV